MHFTLVDRVLSYQAGVKITTVKSVSLSEEYLADHFPRFPVLPGVLMLEAMTEAAAWLLRITEGFSQTMITLKEAKNVKFGAFVTPGKTLQIDAQMMKHDVDLSQFKVSASVEGKPACSGRLILEHYNLADRRPHLAPTDTILRRHFRQQWALIFQPGAARPTMNVPVEAAVATAGVEAL
jgi:3-hydroxyacyl-[acyl-carrier-protein] dehydratase